MAQGLRRRGWDSVRAVDLLGEGALDPPLFEHAAALGRVFVTNDGPLHAVALEWLRAGRPFRMVYWPKNDEERYSVGQILDAFDELARAPTPVESPVWISSVKSVTSDQAGVFYPLVKRGSYVAKGTRLGYVTDFFGQTVFEAQAPEAGVVLYICAVPSMKKGDTIANVGVVQTEGR